MLTNIWSKCLMNPCHGCLPGCALSKSDDCTRQRQTCCETGTQSRESFAGFSRLGGRSEPRKSVWLPKAIGESGFSPGRSSQTKRDLALVVKHHTSLLRRFLFLTINCGSRFHGLLVSADPRSAERRLSLASLMDQLAHQSISTLRCPSITSRHS